MTGRVAGLGAPLARTKPSDALGRTGHKPNFCPEQAHGTR